MAELPEVETLRRQLERDVVGRKVKTVEVNDTKVIPRHSTKKQFASMLEGTKLKSLIRRGTFLIFTLDTGDRFIIRPGAKGQLRKAGAKDDLEAGTGVVITFTQGGQLRYVDPKRTGELWILTPEQVAEGVDEIELLGYDVVDQPVPWADFAKLVLSRSVKLKTLLNDEDLLAGIGDVYSDEILYDAGLRYDRLSDSLSVQEVRRLYRSVVEILHDAIKHGGTTLPDDGWRDLHGDAGGYNEYHQVYGRDGEPCRRCRDVVAKAKFGGKNTYFCEQCQT
ncbi:MAG TPA: DNA-formamidopyrimidine glycosylase [Acidimicrobiales bacterium]|nr:DNA-formamidopyrimidine glycosylase [Acidimicrobiales bacterium]